jgi:hypothetical protein
MLPGFWLACGIVCCTSVRRGRTARVTDYVVSAVFGGEHFFHISPVGLGTQRTLIVLPRQ